MAAAEVAKRCVGQYEIKETLGKGGYSWVKKGIDGKTGSTVALKFMSRADKSWEKEQAEQVRTEIKSMIRIKSKNVMKLFAYNLNCKYPEKNGNTLNTILLVLEFCPGGELFDILYYTQQLDEVTARTYFLQMLNGLAECHAAGIIHRDLKPQNLLMDAHYQLKITDFGLSKLVRDADTAVMKTHYVGTRGYQAPELLKKKKYGKACDIFSAGVVLFILLTGYPPFEQAVKSDKWYNPLAVGKPEKFWAQHKGCGVKVEAREMLTQMLAYHPSERSTIDEILKSDFAQGPTHTAEQLYSVLRRRHRETSKRRKKDKKKMNEMEHSIKKKRETNQVQETMNMLLGGKPCPIEKYEERQSLMTKRWIVRPNKQTKSEQKEDSTSIPEELVNAYLVAMQALECKGKSELSYKEKNNPWEVNCLATDMDGSRYQIQMSINKDENDVYYFNFKRIGGDALKFHKFWENCEIYFIHSKYFMDELDEEADDNEKFQVIQNANKKALNTQQEIDEKIVEDDSKQEE